MAPLQSQTSWPFSRYLAKIADWLRERNRPLLFPKHGDKPKKKGHPSEQPFRFTKFLDVSIADLCKVGQHLQKIFYAHLTITV
jgi:hypothetical protein